MASVTQVITVQPASRSRSVPGNPGQFKNFASGLAQKSVYTEPGTGTLVIVRDAGLEAIRRDNGEDS